VKVIIGLGNPGLRFRRSRHNLGFLVVEKLARLHRIKITQKNYNCVYGQGWIGNQYVFLAKPLTFVNLSGQAVISIIKKQKIHEEDLLVICDDINLSLGKIRIRATGSDGGHKGLRSIIETLKTKEIPRLRIGVGTAQIETRRIKLSKYVLAGFNRKEIKIIDQAIEEAAACCEIWIKEGIVLAMNKVNRKGV
jgi:PTH1 family peptidyl-tRNA hydrolase